MGKREKSEPGREKTGVGVDEESGNKNGGGIDRRGMLKVLGAAGVTVTGLGSLQAAETADSEDPFGMLIDTTRCVGCRNCELVCAETNGLPEPDHDDNALEMERKTTDSQWTVVNRYETDAGEVFAKKQCMHCVQPACAAACLTKAMLKTEEGPVIWRESKCMGCRFCMVSCPFDIPKFEYDSPVPKIQKCILCWDRVKEGELPACVENCPAEALTFGRRSELLKDAHQRLCSNPGDYYPAIYGDKEVGGTSALYLAAVPFEQLGFRTDLGTSNYPELTKQFLYSVPIVLTVLPAFLLGLSQATRRDPSSAKEEGSHE